MQKDKPRSSKSKFIVPLIIFLLVSLSSLNKAYSTSGIPNIISYQGRLTDSSSNLLGGSGTIYYFKFSIWDNPTSNPLTGNRLWPAAAPGIATSTVTNGVFNVNIGDTANGYPDALNYDFYTNSNVYLQVDVSSDGSSFETLSPRQRISSSGFAINANNVSGQLSVTSSADYTFNVINNGTGLANLQTQGQVRVGNFSSAPTALGGGSLYYDTTNNNLFIWNTASSSWVSLGGTSGGTETLQQAYNLGNTIQTTNSRDILFNLVHTGSDSNFTINIASSSAGLFQIESSSSPILTISQTKVTSTSALSWNIQGATTLSTTTINNGLNIQTGSLQVGGTTRLDSIGQATLTTSTISSLSVSGTTTLASTTISGQLTLSSPLSISNGGTGIGTTPTTNGQLLMASSTSWAVGNLMAGAGITIATSTSGQITFTNSAPNFNTTTTINGMATSVGILAGTGITLASTTNNLTITNANPNFNTTTTISGLTGNISLATSTTSNNWSISTSSGLTFNYPYNLDKIRALATTTGQLIQATGDASAFQMVATSSLGLAQIGAYTTTTVNGSSGAVTLSFATSTAYSKTSFYFTTTTPTAFVLNYPTQINDLAGIATTTGNLIAASTTGWKALGVGSNGQLLQANSASALGLNWVGTSTLGFAQIGAYTTTTPGGSDTQIQFNNGGSFLGDANFTWASSSALFNLRSPTGTVLIGTSTNPGNALFAIATSSPIFYVSSTGNVGIGTTTPGYPLAVSGIGYFTGGLGVQGATNANNTFTTNPITMPANGYLASVNSTGNNYVQLIGTNGSNSVKVAEVNASQLLIGTNTGIKGSGEAGPSNALDVNGAAAIGYYGTVAPSNGLIVSGNVGIGTTNPSSTLYVVGSTTVTTLVSTTNLFTTNATTSNLAITGLAGQSGCLSVNASGTVTTSTCSGGTGITSLNGLTNGTQTFATGTTPNASINIVSSGSTHTFYIGQRLDALNQLATTTGNIIVATSSPSGWTALGAGTSGQVLQSNSGAANGLQWTATSSLGLAQINSYTTTTVAAGSAISVSQAGQQYTVNVSTSTNSGLGNASGLQLQLGANSTQSCASGFFTSITATGTIACANYTSSTLTGTSVSTTNGYFVNATTTNLTVSASGTTALFLTGFPQVTSTNSLIAIGPIAIVGGHGSGTYLGLNAPGTFQGNLVDFQSSSTSVFKISSSGVMTAGTSTIVGNLTLQSGVLAVPTQTSSTNLWATHATTSDLSIKGLAGQAGCLSVDSNGTVTTSTCSGGSGITSLNGLTAGTQTFATGTTPNASINIVSSGSTHTFYIGQRLDALNQLATTTGNIIVATSSPNGWTALGPGSNGQLLQANSGAANGLQWTATSSLGLAQINSYTTTTLNGSSGAVSLTLATSTSYSNNSFYFTTTTPTAFTLNYPTQLNDLAGIATTTGNLIAASTTGWKALSAGTNGQILQANSASSLGLNWVGTSTLGLAQIGAYTTTTISGLTGNISLATSTTSNNWSISTSSGLTFNYPYNLDKIRALATTTGQLIQATGDASAFQMVATSSLGLAQIGAYTTTTITGTSNQVSTTASTGNITLSLPQNINPQGNVTFNQVTATTLVSSTNAFHQNATTSNLSVTASGTPALFLTGFPQVTSTNSLITLGPYPIVGNGSGTYLGLNVPSFSGNLVDFQIASSSKFSIVSNGGVTTTALTISALANGFLKAGATGIVSTSTISLTADVSGILPAANGGFVTTTIGGLSATAYTFSTSTTGNNWSIATSSPGTLAFNYPYNLEKIRGLATTTGQLIQATGDTNAFQLVATSSLGLAQIGAYTTTTITGTSNQVSTTASTGNITLSLPQNINPQGNVTFNQVTATTLASSTNLFTTNATTTLLGVTGTSTLSGKVLVNTTATSTGQVNVVGTASGGATVTVAGLYQESLLNPSASGQFQFGNRHIVTINPSASSSMDGEFVRTIDNTSLNNTVRAMELQAWSGTNSSGINTGLWSAGRTFGVQAISNGTNGATVQPAALYGEIQASTTASQALRLYSNLIATTSQDMAQFYQETSNFSGNGLEMKFANNGGTFTGNFLQFMNGTSMRFAVNATGTLMIGTSTPYQNANLVVCAQSNCTLPTTNPTSTVAVFASSDGTVNTASIWAVGTITGGKADVGEYVPVSGDAHNYEEGDLLAATSTSSTSTDAVLFAKTNGDYDSGLTGVVTPASAFIAGGDSSDPNNSLIMALAGRVPVKVNGENGPITIGDPITASSKVGEGMRASEPGRVVGMALQSFDATSTDTQGKIMVLISSHWYYPPLGQVLQGGTMTTGETLNTYTFDPNTVFSFNNLKVQNLEVGSSSTPSGITIYDTQTRNPFCIEVENGVLKAMPGSCSDVIKISSSTTSGATTTSGLESGGQLLITPPPAPTPPSPALTSPPEPIPSSPTPSTSTPDTTVSSSIPTDTTSTDATVTTTSTTSSSPETLTTPVTLVASTTDTTTPSTTPVDTNISSSTDIAPTSSASTSPDQTTGLTSSPILDTSSTTLTTSSTQ